MRSLSPAVVSYGVKPLIWAIALTPAWLLGEGIWLSYNGDPGALGADPVEYIVHGTGETAVRMLVATLAMSTLKDVFHLVWAARLRRLFGLFTFAWALLHVCAFAWLELEGDLGRLLAEVIERPYILAGAVAVLAMVPLAVTSTLGWRRRLGPRWKALHRLVWLAALGASVHLIWQARSDLGDAALYSGAFLLLAAQRWIAHRSRRAQRRGPQAVPDLGS